jgi:uroporphyrinogen decarboxylase
MRQAGRSLPEYRSIKERYSLLEICRRPDLCAEVTVQPVKRFGVDAAVLYADITHPLVGIGIDLQLLDGVGPVIAEPIRDLAGVQRLRDLDLDSDLGWVTEDVRAVLARLDGSVPLIGFTGAPFTLASYLVEGRPSKDFLATKALMYQVPELWNDLMGRLARIIVSYGELQACAGVHALQVFDSWAGALSFDDYVRYVQPYSRSVLEGLASTGVPIIHFGTAAGALLEAMRDAGGGTIGVDWRVPIDVAWKRIGHDRGIQGNLDPAVLLGPWDVVRREASAILERTEGRPGHVFNTGHGLHPMTEPDIVTRLVEYIHNYERPPGV